MITRSDFGKTQIEGRRVWRRFFVACWMLLYGSLYKP